MFEPVSSSSVFTGLANLGWHQQIAICTSTKTMAARRVVTVAVMAQARIVVEEQEGHASP